jgi:hypothetical protein
MQRVSRQCASGRNRCGHACPHMVLITLPQRDARQVQSRNDGLAKGERESQCQRNDIPSHELSMPNHQNYYQFIPLSRNLTCASGCSCLAAC